MAYEKSQSKFSKKERMCMFQESWFVGLGQVGGYLCEGGETV